MDNRQSNTSLLEQPTTNSPAVDQRSIAPQQQIREPWLVNFARSLRESEILYSGMVRLFRWFQRAGITISPNHFYWPIGDLSELERRKWRNFCPPAGCRMDLEAQLSFAREIISCYQDEYRFPQQAASETGYHYNNGYFETFDAEVAYSLVRHKKPARIIEIGAGFSTRVMAAALQANVDRDGVVGELISIDPYPVRMPNRGLGDFVTVIQKPVQDLDIGLFDCLEDGDILFIDSSHVVGVGSDVVCEYLEIMPRLHPGVLVHLHDIFLPADYPRKSVLQHLWFWSEQYLLQAFLSFNTSFEVLWASSAMHLAHADALESIFPQWKNSFRNMPKGKRRFVPSLDGERIWPSSFWMKRV